MIKAQPRPSSPALSTVSNTSRPSTDTAQSITEDQPSDSRRHAVAFNSTIQTMLSSYGHAQELNEKNETDKKFHGALPVDSPQQEENQVSLIAGETIMRFRRPPVEIFNDFVEQLKSICHDDKMQARLIVKNMILKKEWSAIKNHLTEGPMRGLPNGVKSITDFAEKCPEVFESTAFCEAYRMATGKPWNKDNGKVRPDQAFNPAEKIRQFLETHGSKDGVGSEAEITELYASIYEAEFRNTDLLNFITANREKMSAVTETAPYTPR